VASSCFARSAATLETTVTKPVEAPTMSTSIKGTQAGWTERDPSACLVMATIRTLASVGDASGI